MIHHSSSSTSFFSFILSSSYIFSISESSYDKFDGSMIDAKDPRPVPTDLAMLATSPVNMGVCEFILSSLRSKNSQVASKFYDLS